MSPRRKQIEEVVRREKAISFTDIKKSLSLSNGVLQYHLKKSENIEKRRGAVIKKNFCDECNLRTLCNEKCLLKTLNKPVKRQITKMKAQGSNQADIAEELGLDPSTVNYHLTDLESKGVLKNGSPVEKVRDQLNV